LPQGFGGLGDIVYSATAVKQAVFTVQMKMYEF